MKPRIKLKSTTVGTAPTRPPVQPIRVLNAASDAYYEGASRITPGLAGWRSGVTSADTALEKSRDLLIDRSLDALRNFPLAQAAIGRIVLSACGTGLRPHPTLNAAALGLDIRRAKQIEGEIAIEFQLYAGSQEFDAERRQNFFQQQGTLSFVCLSQGDAFAVKQAISRPGSRYITKWKLIEPQRIRNPHEMPDSDRLVGGVEMDAYGAPVAYHVRRHHPGDRANPGIIESDRLDVFGARTGRRQVLHAYNPQSRASQTRGAPILAGVLEEIAQNSRYAKSEEMRALAQSMHTAFVTSSSTDGDYLYSRDDRAYLDAGGDPEALRMAHYNADPSFGMGAGTIAMLQHGDSIVFPSPTAPNSVFGPFQMETAINVGSAVGIPAEVLRQHFQSSYSAAKGALIEAWRMFLHWRYSVLVSQYCAHIYTSFLDEAVARGYLDLPGYGDPKIAALYADCEWVGPPAGALDEEKEVSAARARIELGISTRRRETQLRTGQPWDVVHAQQVWEDSRREEDGLELREGEEGK